MTGSGCVMSVMMMMIMMMMMMIIPTHSENIVFPSPTREQEKNTSFWYETMSDEIQEAIRVTKNNNIAKNIILFLGDGMGVTVNTVGRIMKGQQNGQSGEEGFLVWDRFPNVALLKTYNVDKQVSDSAGTATAYLTGVKANYYTVGVSASVEAGDCEASLDPANRPPSILKWAQDAGKHTGIVTNTQVTHATPSGSYAKAAHRYWQCDAALKKDGVEKCKDISRQLVEDDPGRNIKVILGGGREEMGAIKEEMDTRYCVREDGRNLVEEWKSEKEEEGQNAQYVTTTGELMNVDVNSTDYLMGLFSERHMPYYVDRNNGSDGTPRLIDMVEKALGILTKSENGFFLLVEGGLIDKGLHRTQPRRAFEEMVEFDKAVSLALSKVNLEETLFIVTADHSHAMTFTGYPVRGNHILGTTKFRYVTDDLPYTSIMFTTGPGFYYNWDGEKVQRRNLTGVDTTDKDFISQSAVPTVMGEEAHGGEDVPVFAIGPMSHLFHRVHEQTYVAHVMAYSACIGPYKNACHRTPPPIQNINQTNHNSSHHNHTNHQHSDHQHSDHQHSDHQHSDHHQHSNHHHSVQGHHQEQIGSEDDYVESDQLFEIFDKGSNIYHMVSGANANSISKFLMFILLLMIIQ